MKKYAEGAAALLLLLAAGGASAGDDGIPALLKFAEQQQAVPVVEKAPPTPQPIATRPKPAATARTDSARLTALNQAMQQQAETIRRLEQQLAAQTQAKSPVPAPTPKAEPVDIRPLVAALKGVRRAIATPPDLIAMAAALARQQRLVTEQDRQLQQLNRQLAAQSQPPGLVSDADKQAYAAGVSLGRDILKLQEENRRLGIEADRPRLLAGIADTLAGKPRLDDTAIGSALQATDAALQQAQQQRQQALRQDSKTYLVDFARQPGVKKDALGFYYRVDYAGDGQIAASDSVDIVVRESLPGGQVIKDMELAGTVISQPLAQYPPLFRAAIGKLNKHGSMTLVVPPALAYGDKGSPPAIPPGATMIYTLRVADVLPQDRSRQK
ncbi:FKBP-type peptidyl-prolyl cis-trans isomerase [Serratia proteamaculans]|uniref:peptidylprolyl isomerase n=1 Tax=Serratia proteamaculans TaxID=28151 RepID=A0A7U0RQK2_SERPR|nr:FKBP-type peptidyl-prolyl cis-trans isomerase N-terminal domain-containing protein [Serratia proteamaculans]MBO1505156.1 FKBP-type peptidyl-prolyl cis-trans isomerase [Serratia proteamaculans]MDW5512878.1 FKBP-type peptidyl-prolyl cis-trans isomerase N-terminal domain-containing protein [Serratia proteamaculans]QQX55205.1 FKBP-type peptidyl-prolyl cis-trans isomerase [Serratia proteamaculans]